MTPALLTVVVVLTPALGRWLGSRPRLAWFLAAASLLPLLALTLAPVDREIAATCHVDWVLPTLGRVEPMANLVLFVPPVLLAGIASRRPGRALLVGSAGSAAIELLQALVPAMGRSCDTGDWVANTLGAAVGAALAWAALRTGRAAGAGPVEPGGPRPVARTLSGAGRTGA